MRLEIDFNSPRPYQDLYRRLLYILPIALAAIALYLWGGPILDTLSPFALAFVLAYLLNPIIDWISGEHRETRKVHRGFAILGLYLGVLLLVAAVVGYLVPLIVSETAQFTRKARDNYLPSLRNELSPRLKEWFSEESLFPPNGTDSGPRSLDPETTGGQRVATGIIPENTYTLRVICEPSADNLDWTVLVSAASATDELKAGKTLQSESFPIPAGGGIEEHVSFPDGTAIAAIGLIPEGTGASSITLVTLDLLRPPPVPLLDPVFWRSLYSEYGSKLTWAHIAQFWNLGARGAGVVAGGAGGVWTWLAERIGGFISFFVYLTLLLVILFYMLLDFTAFKRSCVDLLPAHFRPRVFSVAGKLDEQIGGFIRGQATVCLCVGLLVMTLLLILRVPFAVPIGFLAGAFNFIPYLGPAMGMAPALTLTALEFFDPSSTPGWVLIRLGMVFGAFMLVQMVDGFFLSPKIMSESVDVSPLVVMGALMLGGAVAGVTGMVLAIPTYCALRVATSEYRIELRALRMKREAEARLGESPGS